MSEQSKTVITHQLPNGNLEYIFMPPVMPDSYESSVDALARLFLGIQDPETFDDTYATSMSPEKADIFRLREAFQEAAAIHTDQNYENKYTAAIRWAERALSRDMPEQGEAPLAEVISLDVVRAKQQHLGAIVVAQA